MERPRLLRITTVPISLQLLLTGQFGFMKDNGFEVLTASAAGPQVAAVLKEGVRHAVIPFTRKITPVQDVICLIQLIQLMRAFRPDIVHTHTPKAGLLGMMASRLAGVRVRLHTVAGLPLMESQGIKSMLLRLTEKLTYLFSTRVYSNSAGMMKYMREKLNARGEKFGMIGKGSSNGIDLKYFSRTKQLQDEADQIRSRHHIGSDDFVFIFIGRIVKDKGMVELVRAFQRFDASMKVRLLVVGNFEEELDALPLLTKQFLETNTRVILSGFQQDVRPWIMASQVLVLPSYREGFPNVVMQAAALDVPAIVSDINGCNELVTQQETGLIVPPKDADRLYDAMLNITQGQRATTMGKGSREFVARNFDRQLFWNELLKEYRSFLN